MAIQFRQNNCVIEYSEDNGAIWKQLANIGDCVDSLIGGDDAELLRCSIANYLSDILKDAQAKTIAGYRANSNAVTVAGLILGAIGAIGLIPTVGLSGAGTIAAISTVMLYFGGISGIDLSTYEASLNTDFYEHIKCKLLEILPSGGNFDQRVLNHWSDEIRAYDPANRTYDVVAKFVLDSGVDFWSMLARSAVFQRYPGGCVDCNPPPRCQLYTFSGGQRIALSLQPDGSYLIDSSPEVGSGYHLASAGLKYATQCCEIESVEVVGTFTYPAAPVGFASVFSSCRNDSITLIAPQSVEDMEGMCFTGFLLRSPQPFSLRIRTKSCGNTVGSPASLAFALASGSVSEAANSYTTNVVLSLPANATLSESMIVPVSVVQAATTAESGDYALQTASVTFPAGSANGATQPVTLTINTDTDLDNESVTLRLGNPTSGALGAITEHTVVIEDIDCTAPNPGPGTYTYSGLGGNWSVEVGTPSGSTVQYVPAPANEDQIRVVFCANSDFTVERVSMENRFWIGQNGIGSPMCYGVRFFGANNLQVHGLVFWNAGTHQYDWWFDGADTYLTGIRKVVFYGHSVNGGYDWAFRNLKVVIS